MTNRPTWDGGAVSNGGLRPGRSDCECQHSSHEKDGEPVSCPRQGSMDDGWFICGPCKRHKGEPPYNDKPEPCPSCHNPDCKREGQWDPWECLEAALRKKERTMMNSPISDEDALEAIRWCWVNNATIDFLCVGGVRVSVWTIHTSSLRFKNPVPSKVEGQGANLALAIADWKANAGEDHTIAILEKLTGGRKKRRGRS